MLLRVRSISVFKKAELAQKRRCGNASSVSTKAWLHHWLRIRKSSAVVMHLAMVATTVATVVARSACGLMQLICVRDRPGLWRSCRTFPAALPVALQAAPNSKGGGVKQSSGDSASFCRGRRTSSSAVSTPMVVIPTCGSRLHFPAALPVARQAVPRAEASSSRRDCTLLSYAATDAQFQVPLARPWPMVVIPASDSCLRAYFATWLTTVRMCLATRSITASAIF